MTLQLFQYLATQVLARKYWFWMLCKILYNQQQHISNETELSQANYIQNINPAEHLKPVQDMDKLRDIWNNKTKETVQI